MLSADIGPIESHRSLEQMERGWSTYVQEIGFHIEIIGYLPQMHHC